MQSNLGRKLSTIKGISPLTFKDEGLVRSLFPQNYIKYSFSFLYLLRASHDENGNPGYKYIDSDLSAIIGHRNGYIYVTPITDVTGGINLKRLCQTIMLKTNSEVILKKFSQTSFPQMKQLHKGILTPFESEDDTYPETVLKLSRLFITLEGDINPTASKFIKKVKRFNKFNLEFEIVNDIKKIPEKKILQFLRKDPKKYSNYLPVIKYLYIHAKNTRYKIMIFMFNNDVQGLYITELYSFTSLGFYCGVTAKNMPGITEWMDWYFFKEVLREGTRTIYLGGSETIGVAQYVEKLLPEKPDYHVAAVPFENFMGEEIHKSIDVVRKRAESQRTASPYY